MSSDHIEVEGVVINSVKGIMVIELPNKETIKAKLSGKMRQNKINVIVGDLVKVKVSPYDLTNGLITTRLTKVSKKYQTVEDTNTTVKKNPKQHRHDEKDFMD